MKKKLSLKNKLVFSIIFTIIFFGGLANFFVYVRSKNIILEIAEKKMELINFEKAGILAEVFQYSRSVTTIISNRGEVINYLSDNPRSQDENILNFLEGYNINGIYSAIYIMAPDGKVLISTDPSFTGNNYGFRDYFKEAMEGREYLDVAIGVTSKAPGYYFSSPIKSVEGKIIGVIAVKMIPDYLHKNIHLSGSTGEMSVMLADSNGIVIYSTDKSKIYKSLGKLTKEKLDSMEKKKQFPGIKIEPLAYDAVLRQLPSIKSKLTLKIFDEADGEREILSIVKIPASPFFLISENSLKEFISSSVSVAYILSIFVALAALSALLIIIYIVNKFLKPLTVLDKSVHEIGKGNLNLKIKIKTGDELERLAGHINDMTVKLRSLQSETKKKLSVSKRINKIMVGRELEMKKLKKENEELRKKCNE